VSTEEISGGFILENKSRTFLVDNSLKSRFEKIWEEILPFIIKDIYENSVIRYSSKNYPEEYLTARLRARLYNRYPEMGEKRFCGCMPI